MALPFSAVTFTVIAFAPTESDMGPLSWPLVTDARLDPLPTSTVALDSLVVGVSFTCVLSFATDAV